MLDKQTNKQTEYTKLKDPLLKKGLQFSCSQQLKWEQFMRPESYCLF